MKYSADEARRLKTYGEIPESIEVGTGGEGDEQNDLVTFDDLSGNEGSAASKSEEEKSDGFDSDNIDDVICGYTYFKNFFRSKARCVWSRMS